MLCCLVLQILFQTILNEITEMAWQWHNIYICLKFNPRANGAKCRSGRKPGARVTNSARLFTPRKMRTQRSVTAGKFAAAVQK